MIFATLERKELSLNTKAIGVINTGQYVRLQGINEIKCVCETTSLIKYVNFLKKLLKLLAFPTVSKIDLNILNQHFSLLYLLDLCIKVSTLADIHSLPKSHIPIFPSFHQ